jgi:hypothetical protein
MSTARKSPEDAASGLMRRFAPIAIPPTAHRLVAFPMGRLKQTREAHPGFRGDEAMLGNAPRAAASK